MRIITDNLQIKNPVIAFAVDSLDPEPVRAIVWGDPIVKTNKPEV